LGRGVILPLRKGDDSINRKGKGILAAKKEREGEVGSW